MPIESAKVIQISSQACFWRAFLCVLLLLPFEIAACYASKTHRRVWLLEMDGKH